MNKYVLITGSTSGMGYEWGKKFASEGYNLILVSRDQTKLELQKKDLENYKISTIIIQQDLSTTEAAKEVYKKVSELGLRVEILINNAGFNVSGKFIDNDYVNEESMIKLHIMTLTELTKLFLPEMIKDKSGKILNVGSTGSYIASPLDAIYSATKAYILSFSNALSYELKNTGVTVSTLCPGATKTEFAKKANIENTLLFKFFVMSSEDVINKSYKKFIKGKRVIVPGIYNRLLIISSKIVPVPILNFICAKMMKS